MKPDTKEVAGIVRWKTRQSLSRQDDLHVHSGRRAQLHRCEGSKVQCDGNEAKQSIFTSGSTIRKTICKDDKHKILSIDCGEHIPLLTPANDFCIEDIASTGSSN